MKKIEKIEFEYDRLLEIFKNSDENKLAIMDGHIKENARLKVELDDLNDIVKKSGLVKVNMKNPKKQVETTVSKVIVKVRANYINSTRLLCKELLGSLLNETDDNLEEFE